MDCLEVREPEVFQESPSLTILMPCLMEREQPMYMEPGYPNHWSICHEDYDRSRQITVRRTAVKGRVNNLQWTAIERTAVKGRERSGLAMF